MEALDFWSARRCVIDTVRAAATTLPTERVSLQDALGRVLAENVNADRDYPPVARSIRDGFAVRSKDLPGRLRLIGEVRAGQEFEGVIGPGECIRIMTGAPVPSGADAVVMVEHARVEDGAMFTERTLAPGTFINFAGSEAHQGEPVLCRGTRIDFPQIAMLATVGAAQVAVYRRPEVAILATGDEIVPIEATPRHFEVRNSNSWALAAQVARAGGIPKVLPVAPDDLERTVQAVGEGLQSDLLLLSGGVSAGEYDYVEAALARHGAEFYFTRVLLRPGAPAVFGRAAGRFFFGLPGNPLSTAVTFEVFARAAMELLGGIAVPSFRLASARISDELREKPGLTRFLPALLDPSAGTVAPLAWRGSSDVPTLARSNCFLLAEADRELYEKGQFVTVLLP